MPANQPLWRRLTTATRWPVGIALTSWHYMWRTTPLHRSEEEGSWAEDAPPDLPAGADLDEIQRARDGAGPLFHRRYEVTIRDSPCSPERLMAILGEDLDRAAPTEFATFKKLRGTTGDLQVGDEYVVRMPGPWDGPVRVVERNATSFRLITLEGHLEAGQIRFSAADGDDGRLMFAIESWARGGDRLSNLLYDRLRMSKEIQFHMWTSFLEGVLKLSGGDARRRPAGPHPPRGGATAVDGGPEAPARQAAQLRPGRAAPRSPARPAGTSMTTASRCRPSAPARQSPAGPGSARAS